MQVDEDTNFWLSLLTSLVIIVTSTVLANSLMDDDSDSLRGQHVSIPDRAIPNSQWSGVQNVSSHSNYRARVASNGKAHRRGTSMVPRKAKRKSLRYHHVQAQACDRARRNRSHYGTANQHMLVLEVQS